MDGTPDSDTVLPTSFGQDRLWLLWKLEPRSPAYTMFAAVRLQGRCEVGTLERAIRAVVDRHEVLRTTFAEHDGVPAQVVRDRYEIPLELIDLEALAPAARDAEIARIIGTESRRVFDLEQGPLLRVSLLQLGAEDALLLVSMHHIVSDGWSVGVFVREVSALYAADLLEMPSPLPELPIQYADYAQWQRDRLVGDRLEQLRSYWRNQLSGAPTALDVLTDRPRPSAPSHRGDAVRVAVGAGTVRQLRVFTREAGTTPFMVLLAAWALVLTRHSGQPEVVVGAPVANRTRAELEGLIGFLVNTLPLRVCVRPEATGRELLAHVRAVTLGAYSHQDLPFDKIVETLGVPRDISRTPVFQALLALQNTPPAEAQLPGLTLTPYPVESTTAKFDLELDLQESDEDIAGALEFATEIFDRATAARIAAHFVRALEGIVTRPDAPVWKIELLSDAERATILLEFNHGAGEWADDTTALHAGFEAQAVRTPDALAVTDGETSLTYRELNERASRVARSLIARGVGRESLVAICTHRSAWIVVCLLGVLKAGAAYVPLDPSYPRARLTATLEDASVRWLLSERGLLPDLQGMAPELIAVEDALQSEQLIDSPAAIGGRHSAYVIYTSGSTGRPKGVQIEHRSAVAFLDWSIRTFGADELSRVLFGTSICFDLSIFEVFAPLSRGGAVVVARDALQLPTVGLRHGVTLVNTVPSAIGALLAEESARLPPSVQTVNLAGEPLTPTLAARVHAAGTVRLLNLYGPTEDTTYSTWTQVEPGAPEVTIGRAIDYTQAYVLDARLRPVPIGVRGRIYLAGAGLARGYLGQPGLTAERFLPDPFSPLPGGRMYDTGDVGSWRADGTLRYFGRADFQVKVRGFRIELGEIDAALSKLPGVSACVAVAREDDASGTKRLVAYASGTGLEAEALRRALRDRLPEYMVPGTIIVLDKLPLTPNGKIDRKALPAPSSPPSSYEPPAEGLEQSIAAAFEAVLRRPRVGANDNFFELGGHSLLATQLVSRLRKETGRDFPLREVFDAPTPRALAVRISGAHSSASGTIKPADRSRPLPLSFAQERLWLLEQLQPGTYTMSDDILLDGDLDVAALQASLNALLERHDIFRMRVVPDAQGIPLAHFAPTAGLTLDVVDLRDTPGDQRLADARKRARQVAGIPFDLASGPLLRAKLFRLGDRQHLVSFAVHHIAADGWSMANLIREVATLYTHGGSADSLPPLPIQYADYAAWEREQMRSGAGESSLGYWSSKLADLPSAHATGDRARGAAGQRGEVETAVLPARTSEAISALARAESATPFMVLLAALQLLAARHSGTDRVTVGSPVANRTTRETEPLIGPLLNTLILVGEVKPSQTFRQLLRESRATALEAYTHQAVPLELVLQRLAAGVKGRLDRTPLFRWFLNVLNVPKADLQAGGIRMQPLPWTDPLPKFDLEIYVQESDAGMEFRLVYDADRYSAGWARELLGQLCTLLEQVVVDPDRRQGELSLRTPAAAASLPDPTAPLSRKWEGAIQDIVSTWASRFPDRTAVRDSHSEWTYAALDDCANDIAARLVSSGLTREQVVAIWAHRSATLVPAIIGVLRAGGAVLMLDPSHPPSRNARAVSSARVSALLALDAAGEVPAEVLEKLRDVPNSRRLVLPRGGPEALRSSLAGASSGRVAVAAAPDQAAFVALTSGSTGDPKVVVALHGSLTHFLPWIAEHFALTATERVSMASGLAHDPLQRDVFTALQLGATLVVPDPELLLDPGALAAWMSREEITVANLTPSLAKVLDTAPGTRPRLRLRAVFFVGEPLTQGDVARLRAVSPGVRCVNLYGTTETQRALGYYECGTTEEEPAVLPLGWGMPGSQLLVVSEGGALAGVGEVGEIWIRSHQLARGYLDDDTLTAQKFGRNAFGATDDSRVYRTGDRARYRLDGAVEIVGRVDDQVKIRGVRVEPGEVSAALSRHQAIGSCAVVAAPDGKGGMRLVAYVVPARNTAPTASMLRSFLATQLPSAMVPEAFAFLDRLPITPNGKLDRRALPPPPEATAGAAFEAPAEGLEQVVAKAFATVLHREHVGATDNFFEAGGHSLLATQLVSNLRAATGRALPLRAVFDAPTVRGIARQLATAAVERAEKIPRADRSRRLPLSFEQERLWFLEQLTPGSSEYNMHHAVRLEGRVDEPALRHALNEVVTRHESLRTTFESIDGTPFQRIADVVEFHLAVDDLSALSPTERDRAVAAKIDDVALAPFDLGAGPLFRACLIRIASQQYVLVFAMHHIVSDGWSMAVFVRELVTLYQSRAQLASSRLPPLPVQYVDYAVWQRSQLTGEALDAVIEYWRKRLAGAPSALEFPTDRPRSAAHGFRGARSSADLGSELTESLRALAVGEGATLIMVILAAFQIVLSRWSGQRDVVVGLPTAGRPYAELEGIIGFFVNMLPLRTQFAGDPPFRALLRQVRESMLSAYAHQDLPFEKLVHALQPERVRDRPPIFQVMLNSQDVPREPIEMPSLTLTPMVREERAAHYDLSVYVIPTGQSVRLELVYNVQLFESSTAERLVRNMVTLLRSIAAAPEAHIDSLEMRTPEEISAADDRVAQREKAARVSLRGMRPRGVSLPVGSDAGRARDSSSSAPAAGPTSVGGGEPGPERKGKPT